jgi:hypothetical protein
MLNVSRMPHLFHIQGATAVTNSQEVWFGVREVFSYDDYRFEERAASATAKSSFSDLVYSVVLYSRSGNATVVVIHVALGWFAEENLHRDFPHQPRAIFLFRQCAGLPLVALCCR